MDAGSGVNSTGDTAVKLIEDWRHAHKFISNRCMALVIGCNGAYRLLDPSLQAALPPWLLTGLSFALLGLGMVGTVIDQAGSDNNALPTGKTNDV
jgi:hypothetical protein